MKIRRRRTARRLENIRRRRLAKLELLETRRVLAVGFSPAIDLGTGLGQNFGLESADIDSDGDADLLAASRTSVQLTWYDNDGSGGFTQNAVATNSSGANTAHAVDMDLDGDQDIVVSSLFDDKVAWLENDGSQGFTERIITTSLDGAFDAAVADYDGDGDLDVVATASTGFNGSPDYRSIAFFENDGSFNFTKSIFNNTQSQPGYVVAADVDQDGDTDVVSSAFGFGDLRWYENDGAGNFTDHILAGAGNVSGLVVEDIDQDGDVDFVTSQSSSITFWENDGSQGFSTSTLASGLGGITSVTTGDMNGDSQTDLLYTAPFIKEMGWFENDGSQNFTKQVVATTADVDGPARAIAFDADGDGDQDIAWSDFSEDSGLVAWNESLGVVPVANDAVFNVDENSAATSSVGTVTATNPDPGETLTYTITAGNMFGAFSINGATGEITVNNAGALDFETTPVFNLTVPGGRQ